MQSNRLLSVTTAVLLAGVLLSMGVLIFQIDTLEERFIAQSRQLRALGEATDRVAMRVDRLSRSRGPIEAALPGAGHDDEHSDVEVLHPEVENFLSAPDFSIANQSVPTDGVIVRGWASGDPKGFNPLTENAADLSSGIEAYVASAIARRKSWTDPNQWAGDLAWRVEITDDFKEFTIYLRPGVRWHSPSGVDLADSRFAWLRGDHTVSAHDLVFAYDMLMNPQVENGFIKSYYQDLESWEALDDTTFRVRWKRKLYGNISQTLGFPPLPEFLWAYDEHGERFPEETIGLRFNQHWYNNKGYVGSGPYRMVSYEPGVQINLERNPDYYGEMPSIRRIEYPIYTDPKRTLLMLKAKELTFGGLLPSEYREEILSWQHRPKQEWPENNPFLNGELEHRQLTRPAYSYIGWNAERPFFSDKRVRRAMTLAFDRAAIIDEIYVGLGEVANGPFLASGPYNDPDVDPLAFDLERAAGLLAAAGWVDSDGDGVLDADLSPEDGIDERTPFEFTLLLYANAPEWLSAANVFQRDLISIGVKMKIAQAEWSLMQKRMEEKDFDAYSGGWALGWDQDPYQLWHSSQADIAKGSNRVGFRSARADELIEKLRETFDPDLRIEMLREVHRLIYEQQAYTFFRVPQTVVAWNRSLRGVRFAITRPRTNSLPWWIEKSE